MEDRKKNEIFPIENEKEKNAYISSVFLFEKLHKLFLNVVKKELVKIGVNDINNVQTLILYNLGYDKIYIAELISRGYYMGSNVSYNLKKLVTAGYIDQTPSEMDKRAYFIQLSNKGLELFKRIEKIFDKHIELMSNETNKFKPSHLTVSLSKMDTVFNDFLKN